MSKSMSSVFLFEGRLSLLSELSNYKAIAGVIVACMSKGVVADVDIFIWVLWDFSDESLQ